MASSKSNLNTPKKQTSIEENKSNVYVPPIPEIPDHDHRKHESLLQNILERCFVNHIYGSKIQTKPKLSCSNLDIQIHTNSLSNLIDPKVLAEFQIESVLQKFGSYWKYMEERVNQWIANICKNLPSSPEKKTKCTLIKLSVGKFYRTCIKGLWKDMYKISEVASNQEKRANQSSPATFETMINELRDFLNILETVISETIGQEEHLNTANQLKLQKSLVNACIYSLCLVYRSLLENNPDYIKL